MNSALPIETIRDDLLNAWSNGGAIISAPPGSGKTTALPLWLLNESTQPIYLLIPKRLAVKLAAQQLARGLGESVGEQVGYRLRGDAKTSQKTRLTVTTYGSFLRMLLNEPDSIESSTLILDEFHERSVEQDLTYALINQYVEMFDDRVKRIIMSATLNIDEIAAQTKLPVLSSEGFSHPIDIRFQKTDVRNDALVTSIIEKAAASAKDHLLVFFPGLAEIRRIEGRLDQGIKTLVLHGQLNKAPDLNELKSSQPTVILATNVAESSVTLSRVHTVIDLGLERYATTNPVTGITELKTRQISKASATQRAGRAGRLGPGKVLRLWSEEEHQGRVAHQPPELTSADLTKLVLECRHWGSGLNDLNWLERPSTHRWKTAEQKLYRWEALDDSNNLTIHGSTMLQTGLEPWLAHLTALANKNDCIESAALFAASLMLKSPDKTNPLESVQTSLLPQNLRNEANQILKYFDRSLPQSIEPMPSNVLIQALSDRLVFVDSNQKAKLISGSEVTLLNPFKDRWGLLVDGMKLNNKTRATYVISVPEDQVHRLFPPTDKVVFNPDSKPTFRLISCIGDIALNESSLKPSNDQKMGAWEAYIEKWGEKSFAWQSEAANLRDRWKFMASLNPDFQPWPHSEQWSKIASPFLAGIHHLNELSTTAMLEHTLGFEALNLLKTNVPTTWKTPTGRSAAISYDIAHAKASVSVKLQEIFGLIKQPHIATQIPLTLNLLAPNGRPVASVTDLSHFWNNVYGEIRKELRGRYSKHPWPEDPSSFKPTTKTNRQIRNDS